MGEPTPLAPCLPHLHQHQPPSPETRGIWTTCRRLSIEVSGSCFLSGFFGVRCCAAIVAGEKGTREGIRGVEGRCWTEGGRKKLSRGKGRKRDRKGLAPLQGVYVVTQLQFINHYGENCGIGSRLTWTQLDLQGNCLTSNRRRTLYRKRWARLSSSPQYLTAAPRDNTNLEGNRGVMGCWGGESPERERERRKANRSGWLKFAPLHQRCKDVASRRQHRILTHVTGI